ncbi:hypothetical protein M0R19_08520 [Candidatus Pacearchaeota archaeon]|jgi:hypothetical protein|nr:hypothetical protein [bacterium]MCK9597201.1 hypothetical protein [Candidatus Pacearchaeota archaeon]
MSTHKSNYELLEEWFEELSTFRPKDKFLKKLELNNKSGVKYRIYTDEHYYDITALDGPDGGFLGAVAMCRKQLPNENFKRGDDLYYGPFRKDTWNNILKDIVAYELISIS